AALNLDTVAAVHGLYVEDVARSETEYTLHRCGDVLVHPVREFDDDDRAFARCAHQAPCYGSRATTELAKHDLHGTYCSNRHRGVHLHPERSTVRSSDLQ